ncbi:competence protein ComK [Staphylococcus canis]|uniref:Competence protein ComK n=1 Tax=Staphylococcus canis TaxID=2724942 RepID=A0ABS0T9L1_9STAP|nr:competence protein ComK [Staphylococcus canis]MBI5975245.1 competence protein ComK [Staphylococcus canis]
MLKDNNRAIKSSDMILIPKEKNNNQITEVWQFDGSKTIIDLPVQKVMERSCRFYGDSYSNRKSQTKMISGISNKSPILVAPLFAIYLFPTHSDRVSDNCWINPFFVRKIKPLKGTRTKIIFVNDESVIINVSYHSLKHQMLNCTYFHFLMHREMSIKKADPDKPVDYEAPTFKLFDAMARYALIEKVKFEKLKKRFDDEDFIF